MEIIARPHVVFVSIVALRGKRRNIARFIQINLKARCRQIAIGLQSVNKAFYTVYLQIAQIKLALLPFNFRNKAKRIRRLVSDREIAD
jgi:hypothetical protein